MFRTKIGQMFIALVLSQDDKWLAFSVNDLGGGTRSMQFMVMPHGGGEAKEIYQTEQNTGASLFWGPPGKGILFGVGLEKGKAYSSQICQIWKFPTPDSTRPEKMDLEAYGLLNLAVSPDGRNVAYTANEPVVSKKWAMENYVPKK